MTEDGARCLEILRILVEIRGCAKMAELMRRHVNADAPREGVDDLFRLGLLALPTALSGDEEIAVRVGVEAWQ